VDCKALQTHETTLAEVNQGKKNKMKKEEGKILISGALLHGTKHAHVWLLSMTRDGAQPLD
jgi:hypothetical protein